MRKPGMTLLLAASIGLTACVVAPQAGPPYPIVPAPRAEIVPKPPVVEDPVIWQPGHWDWLGGSYVWTAGTWVPAAGHGARWQNGFWSQSPDGQWLWIAAHWVA